MATACSEPPVAAGGVNRPRPRGLDAGRGVPFVSGPAGVQEVPRGGGVR